MNHVMLDIETWGTGPTSAIASIGAIDFDPHTGELGTPFYQTITLKSCMDAGLNIDADTIEFWMMQSDEARKALFEMRISIVTALRQLEGWFYNRKMLQFTGDSDLAVWSHGATFDPVIVANAYHKCLDCKAPWKYNAVRDTRTLFAITSVSLSDYPMEGTLHNPLDDCRHQVKAVHQAYAQLKMRKWA